MRNDAFIAESIRHYSIRQGYLSKDPDKTIRVRIRDERAFLTIKSNKLREGLAKFEWEREIDKSDGEELLQLCLPGVIDKTRYIVKVRGERLEVRGEGLKAKGERKWEVDVFHGRLEGLVLAEIELGDEHEDFERPEWIGEEVTGLPQYYNANM